MYVRVCILCEGRTESLFAKDILAPYLSTKNPHLFAPRITHSQSSKGGLYSYKQVKGDIYKFINPKGKPRFDYFTTMIDLYALPNDFPGYSSAQGISDPYAKVKNLEQGLANDINHCRFVPYIQLHEFEALLYSDVSKFDTAFPDQPKPVQAFILQYQSYDPETINEGKTTAPSKRILQNIPEYKKTTSGLSIARAIGLSTMRARCPHFDEWVAKLESLKCSSHANSLSQP